MQGRLKELEQEVSGGATAIVALILNNKLYVANVGMSTCFHRLKLSEGLHLILLQVFDRNIVRDLIQFKQFLIIIKVQEKIVYIIY